jgi:hypothetical protein
MNRIECTLGSETREYLEKEEIIRGRNREKRGALIALPIHRYMVAPQT